jgi:DNA modification methylase
MSIKEVENLVVTDHQEFNKDASQVILGDSRNIVKLLPDNFYAACITSPPSSILSINVT